MGDVIAMRVRHRDTSKGDADSAGGYRSGRSSDLGMPVARSIGSTRSGGTSPSSQRSTVLLLTPNSSATRSSVKGGDCVSRKRRSGLAFLMGEEVAPNATSCQASGACGANDLGDRPWHALRMARFHYIPEWAKEAGKKQTHLANAVGVDKSNVSRWYRGVIPERPQLAAIAKTVGAPEPAALFVHPSEYKILQEIRSLREKMTPAA